MADTKRDIINENEHLKADVYNLRLYLTELLKEVPYKKGPMLERFNGMPGFVEVDKNDSAD